MDAPALRPRRRPDDAGDAAADAEPAHDHAVGQRPGLVRLDLDYEIGSYSGDECWRQCEAIYGLTVAVDWDTAALLPNDAGA